MKLTSEEFNAIFTFYDKVRGRTVWNGNTGGPIRGGPGQKSCTLSLGRDELSGQLGPCGFFLSLLIPCSIFCCVRRQVPLQSVVLVPSKHKREKFMEEGYAQS